MGVPRSKPNDRLTGSIETGSNSVTAMSSGALSMDQTEPVRVRPVFERGLGDRAGFRVEVVDEESESLSRQKIEQITQFLRRPGPRMVFHHHPPHVLQRARGRTLAQDRQFLPFDVELQKIDRLMQIRGEPLDVDGGLPR